MAQDMLLGNEEPSSNKETFLQQFCVLAKNATGPALLDVIKQVLDAPNVFVFGELLVEPNVAEVSKCYIPHIALVIIDVVAAQRRPRRQVLQHIESVRLRHLQTVPGQSTRLYRVDARNAEEATALDHCLASHQIQEHSLRGAAE